MRKALDRMICSAARFTKHYRLTGNKKTENRGEANVHLVSR